MSTGDDFTAQSSDVDGPPDMWSSSYSSKPSASAEDDRLQSMADLT